MPVNDIHPDYALAFPVWCRHRDVMNGEDWVKAAGEKYVDRIDGQTDEEFAQYLRRGCFYNATARTHAGMMGLIFRRDVKVLLAPGALDLSDVDLAGGTFNEYAKQVVSEVLAYGRCGTLVDWNDDEGRAYLSLYAAQTILNWRVERIAGRSRVTLVVLAEEFERSRRDEFTSEVGVRYRVLRLVDGEYFVEVYEPVAVEGSTELRAVSLAQPKRSGKPLTEIPFVFHGSESSCPDVERSPLEDLVFTNLDHFRLDVDYKHGIHYTALPTAWVCGFDPSQVLAVGQRTAWVTEQLGATAGYLEFTGKGLGTFAVAQQHDEQLMATQGARMLSQQKRVAESAEAMAMRTIGEDSILATLARACASGLLSSLRWCVWWVTPGLVKPGDASEAQASVELNTDFSDAGMTGRDLLAVVAAWQAGAMSDKAMQAVLKRGELLPLEDDDGVNTAPRPAEKTPTKQE